MAELVTADVSLRLDYLAQTTGVDWATPSENGVLAFAQHLANGAAAKSIEKRWRSVRTLAANASEALDLQALALTVLGLTSTVSFSSIKLLAIVTTTDVAGLRVGGTTSNEWAAPWPSAGEGQFVGPGSPLVIADLVNGFTVSAGSKGLLIANQSATEAAAYEILILGN